LSEKTINYGDLSVLSEKTINYGDLSIQAVLSEKTINYGDLSIQAVLSEKTSKLWLQVMTSLISLYKCKSHIRKGYGLPTCT
jgi:hypothetical protein